MTHAMLALGWSAALAVGLTTLAALVVVLLNAWRPTTPEGSHRRAVVALAAAVAATAVAGGLLLVSDPAVSRVDLRSTAARPPDSPEEAREAAAGTPAPRSARPTPTGPSRRPGRALPLTPGLIGAACVWCLGAVLLLVRLAGGLRAARGFVRRAAPAGDRLDAEVARVGARLGLGRRVRVLESADVDGPAVLGWRAPVLLVPVGFARRLGRAAAVPLLAHELAHVIRRDYAVGIGQRVAEALLWHCPGAHWLSARAREAREQACDDVGAAVGGGARAQAEALAALARWPYAAARAPGLGAAAPDLRARIRRLAEGRVVAPPSPLRSAVVGLAIAALLPLIAAGARTARAHVSRVAAAPAVAPPIPRSFGLDQPGAPVRVVAAPASPAYVFDEVGVRNVSEAVVRSVSFASWVDNPGLGHVQVFRSERLAVEIAPGAAARLPVRLVSASQARKLEAGFGGFAQATLVLVAAELDWDRDGEPEFPHWRVQPRSGARSVQEAFYVPRPGVSRAALRRAAEDRAAESVEARNLCLDDTGRPASHGALVPVLDGDAGELARCRFGRWVAENGPEPEAESGSAVEYLERRRGYDVSAMEEGAASAVFQAAAIVSGEMGYRVDWPEEREMPRRVFSADPWSDPEVTEADWVPDVELSARTRPWFHLLRRMADADGSGFVTEPEALALRFAVELGLVVHALPELDSLAALDVPLMPADADPAFRRRVEPLSTYVALSERAEAEGLVGLPPLPASLRREVERARTD